MNSNRKDPAVLSVGALTRLIRGSLETQFNEVSVEGEISNLSLPSSGHAYFTLKDETAQISAVVWRTDIQRLRCQPCDGLQVLVRGRLTVYEKRGAYQIVVRSMEDAGLGVLFLRFEQLKKALAAEGLFDAARKRLLPELPQHVGVVTSPTGAAIRDILKVIKRRFPNLHIVLAPARVQGEGAAEEIAAAIDLLNQLGGLDVMIVGRGGGSFEELYCFNEEIVARAIARSAIPVISAVGHEVDFTISDFVADVRAPTPSAAAEMVVASKAELSNLCTQFHRRLYGGMITLLERARRRLEKAQTSYVFHEPTHMVRVVRERLTLIRERLTYGLTVRLHEGQQRLDDAATRVTRGIRLRPERNRQELRRLIDQLRILNPLGVLERGYSITRGPDGVVMRDIRNVTAGTCVMTRLARGEFESEVKKIHDAT